MSFCGRVELGLRRAKLTPPIIPNMPLLRLIAVVIAFASGPIVDFSLEFHQGGLQLIESIRKFCSSSVCLGSARQGTLLIGFAFMQASSP
jgi:hypothetical protein